MKDIFVLMFKWNDLLLGMALQCITLYIVMHCRAIPSNKSFHLNISTNISFIIFVLCDLLLTCNVYIVPFSLYPCEDVALMLNNARTCGEVAVELAKLRSN